MLYAINVLKKIIMKEKSYILFWKVKKMWILKHVCLQSTPWTMFCLMKSLCYYCPTFLIPVFSNHCHSFTLLCIKQCIFQPSNQQWTSKTLPSYSICAKDVWCQKSMFSSLNHLHNYRSSSDSSSSSKTMALHATTLTAWLVLIVCFFSLAIIQELSHDCSRANGEPWEYLQRLSVKEIREGFGYPMAGFCWDRQFCSTSPK